MITAAPPCAVQCLAHLSHEVSPTVMARTPLDPSLLAAADADRDASRLDAVVASLLPGARALAERVFAAEVLDAVDGPAQHALASIATSSLDFAHVRSARAAGLLDALTQDERDAIEAHGILKHQRGN